MVGQITGKMFDHVFQIYPIREVAGTGPVRQVAGPENAAI